jgi:recombination DNA repair RAD52 pathway protein
MSVDTRSNEEEALTRIAANHLRQLQQMQSSAAPKSRDFEIAHIVNMFKPPVPLGHAEPESFMKHAAAVSFQPVASSSAEAASAADTPKSVFALPDTPQQAPSGTHESASEAAITKLSEELVIKSACCCARGLRL